MQQESIVSTYRNNYTVETMTRIHNVTGQEFPISGDAPLRMRYRLLKDAMQKEHMKVLLSATYGKYNTDGTPTC